MHKTQITINASSEMELLAKKMILEEIEKNPFAELKRLHELSKIPKAKSYLETAVKFTILKNWLK